MIQMKDNPTNSQSHPIQNPKPIKIKPIPDPSNNAQYS